MIEAGEFFRTKNGYIFKLDYYWLFNDNYKKLDIVSHSSNIIDLIQEGDYVNGYKVISIDRNVPDIHTDCIELDLNNNYEYNFITIHQIKSIVTKEMMKSIEYIVGESNG